MLSISELTHVYANGTRALDAVSLEIPAGMFGLLGPNGAGKSSLMRCLATLQVPTSGRIAFATNDGANDGAIDGAIDVLREPAALRATLGYLPQDFGVYPRVSAIDMLDHLAVLKGLTERGERKDTIETLLRQVNLWDVRKKAIAGFSGGMRQRFGIAQALIGNPRLVIVDEPTAGLDPEERNRFNNLLSEIGENVVVILSTHIVDDVTDLCPRMAILVDGRIVESGTPAGLIEGLRGRIWQASIAKAELDGFRARMPVIATRLRGGSTVIRVLADASPEPDVRAGRGGSRGRVLRDAASASSVRDACAGSGMKTFLSIARFEWRYQVGSPVFWIGFVIFFLLTFGATTVDTIQIGSRGNVNVNAPFAIVQTLALLMVFAMFVVVSMVAGTVIRDDETGFAPILRSTRLTKGAYLTGRFAGSIIAALAVVASIPLAIAIGSAMPWLDSEKVGPFALGDYLYALFVFGLPTLLIVGAAFFALATATRSMMWCYVGVIATIVFFVVSRALLHDQAHETFAALSDPFGLSALATTTKYWTASERNTLLPPLTGLLLWNRLMWVAIAACFFGLASWLFRFETRSKKARKRDAAKEAANEEAEAPRPSRRGVRCPRRTSAPPAASCNSSRSPASTWAWCSAAPRSSCC